MSKSGKLTSMSYLGGKSADGTGSGPWIAKHLPYKTSYIEPFAGMLGILLQRRPSKSETVNDANSRITNWWTQVRDNPQELTRRVANTPVARDEYNNALQHVDSHPDPIERARMFTVLIQCSLTHTPQPTPGSFVIAYVNKSNPIQIVADRIEQLADRLRNVQIENIDACRLLEKTVNKPDILIYCDPPTSQHPRLRRRQSHRRHF